MVMLMYRNSIVCGDCLEIMEDIPKDSIDMILCDLPYGITSRNKWDQIIPFAPLWEQYNRIIKDDGAIVLTAVQPFTSQLIMSNPKMFRYEWIWEKNRSTGFLNAKKMPLRNHENVLVFYKKLPTYNPQKKTGCKPVNSYTKTLDGTNYGKTQASFSGGGQTDRYPTTVQEFKVVKNDNSGGDKFHPTQKPVEMFEYFIKTYTNPGEVVLDNCIGSGTTAIAALRTGRHFIGIEKEKEYCEISRGRINIENGGEK
jgi:DNA modification methylase